MADLHPVVADLLAALRASPLGHLADAAERAVEQHETVTELGYGVVTPRRVDVERGQTQLAIIQDVILGRIELEFDLRKQIIGAAAEMRLKAVVVQNNDGRDDVLTNPQALEALAAFGKTFVNIVGRAREAVSRGEGMQE